MRPTCRCWSHDYSIDQSLRLSASLFSRSNAAQMKRAFFAGEGSKHMKRFTMVLSFVGIAILSTRAAIAQCDNWRPGPLVHTDGTNDAVNVAITWDPDGAGPLTPQLVIGGK